MHGRRAMHWGGHALACHPVRYAGENRQIIIEKYYELRWPAGGQPASVPRPAECS